MEKEFPPKSRERNKMYRCIVRYQVYSRSGRFIRLDTDNFEIKDFVSVSIKNVSVNDDSGSDEIYMVQEVEIFNDEYYK